MPAVLARIDLSLYVLTHLGWFRMVANPWHTLKHLQLIAIALLAFVGSSIHSSFGETSDAEDLFSRDELLAEQLIKKEPMLVDDPEAAAFDQWESLVDDESRMHWDQKDLKPMDWIRHFGFRHSSTHGPHVGRGLPMKGTSVMNRPHHFDWFMGPMFGDDLISNRVSQGNVLLGGIRLGWDFDHYWGLEWRFGWADPKANFASPETGTNPDDVSYVVSDIDLVYYPWGDSKIRPYYLLGFGATRLRFSDENDLRYNTVLATLPFGGGIQFRQSSWLTWRIEILDNLAFGDDRVSTMNNLSITAGMEMRFGAQPRTYWPWRSSRQVW